LRALWQTWHWYVEHLDADSLENTASLQAGPQNPLVLDPFVGTGSLAVAVADVGAISFGVDIDARVLTVRSLGTFLSMK
jgi:predicted RNA methylase